MRIFGVLAALAAFFVPAAAEGQVKCGDRDSLVQSLEEKRQKRVSFGVSELGSLVEVFANADRSEWTVVRSRHKARSCILAQGHGWRDVKPVFGEES